MKKKITLLALCASLLAFCVSAQAQQAQKILRIGYLQVTASSPVAARTEAFRQGLRELGYVEGKNIVVEWRFTEGKADRLPSLAAELVRLKVDVIVTSGPTVTRSAKEAAVTVPIVMTFDNDLLATGSLPALRDLAGTSLDCPRSRRR